MKQRSTRARLLSSLWTGLIAFSTTASAAVFTQEHLSDSLKQELRTSNVWKEGCPVALERLVLLKVSYYDFDSRSHDDGELIVMDAIGPSTLEIFRTLHDREFPFSRIRLIGHYDGDDLRSMEDNNTSAFNCRATTGGTSFSIHSYGLAIDVNPLQNPYLLMKNGRTEILPVQGADFIDRSYLRLGMVEEVLSVFSSHGLSVWGGGWRNPKDWQHFQVSKPVAQLLAAMTPRHAELFYESYTRFHTMLNRASPKTDAPRLLTLYRMNPPRFIELMRDHEKYLDGLTPTSAIQFLQEKL